MRNNIQGIGRSFLRTLTGGHNWVSNLSVPNGEPLLTGPELQCRRIENLISMIVCCSVSVCVFVCMQAASAEKPVWSVLRDDFMMGATMKDWDKDSDREETYPHKRGDSDSN